MQNKKIIYLYIFNVFIINHVVSQPEINSVCGQPNIPYSSTYYPQNNKTYIEDEVINYLCENEYIDLIQTNTCKKGRWTGNSPICGETTEGKPIADANNNVTIKDLETNAEMTFEGEEYISDKEEIGNRLFIRGVENLSQTSNQYSIVINLDKGKVIQLIRLSVFLKNLLQQNLQFSNFDIGSQRKCESSINFNESSTYPQIDQNFPNWYKIWFICKNYYLNDFTKLTNRVSFTVIFPIDKSIIGSVDMYIVEPYMNINNHPICGMPEKPIGIELENILENIQYNSQCDQDFEHFQENVTNIFNCESNMKWSGIYPLCAPKKACRRLSEDPNISKIFMYNNAYIMNQTIDYPIIGTTALIECTNETNDNFNMTIVCGENYEWTDTCGGKDITTTIKPTSTSYLSTTQEVIVTTDEETTLPEYTTTPFASTDTTITTNTVELSTIYMTTTDINQPTQSTTESKTTKIIVTTIYPINKNCSYYGEVNGIGNWPSVPAGQVSTVICPQGSGFIAWKCMDTGVFDENGPDWTQCNKWLEDISLTNIESFEEVINITHIILINTEKSNSIVEFEILKKLMDIFTNLTNLNNITESDLQQTHNYATNLINCLSNTINQLYAWNNASAEEKTKLASDELYLINSIPFKLVAIQNNMKYMEIISENIYINTFITSPSDKLIFPINANSKMSSVYFPNGIQSNNNQTDRNLGAVGSTVHKLQSYLLGGIEEREKVNSDILGFSISDTNTTIELKNEVVITLINNEKLKFGDEIVCKYWDFNTLLWTSEGCYKDEEESHLLTTVCKCNHLTNFAAIMDFSGRQHNDDKMKENLTFIFGGFSICCLIFTIILIKIFPINKKETNITKINENQFGKHTVGNLCISLIAVNLLVITTMDRKEYTKYCQLFSFALLYALLASFYWTFLEGYQIVRSVLSHFLNFKKYKLLYCVGYGGPLITIIIGLMCFWIIKDFFFEVLFDERYNHFCWIASTRYNYHIWLLIGPVIAVMFANLVFVILIIRISFLSKNLLSLRIGEDFIARDKRKMSFIGIFAVMGFTWLSFILYIYHISNFFSYFFILLNGSQGFLILIYQYYLSKSTS